MQKSRRFWKTMLGDCSPLESMHFSDPDNVKRSAEPEKPRVGGLEVYR